MELISTNLIKKLNYYKLINKYYLNYYTLGFYSLCIIYGITGISINIINNDDVFRGRFIMYSILMFIRTINFSHRIRYNITQELYELSREWNRSSIKFFNILDNLVSVVLSFIFLDVFNTTLHWIFNYTIIGTIIAPFIYCFFIKSFASEYHTGQLSEYDCRILRQIISGMYGYDRRIIQDRNYEPPSVTATEPTTSSTLTTSSIHQDNIKLHIDHYKNVSYKNDDQCVICLEKFKDDDEIVILECGHYFKKDCAINWLTDNQACPLCRSKLELV